MVTMTRRPPVACPHCGVEADCHSGATGTSPSAGDVGICFRCGGLQIYTEDGSRAPTVEEASDLLKDPQVRVGVEHIMRMRRSLPDRNEFPPGYSRAVEHVREVVADWLKAHPHGDPPAFAFGPEGITIAASLDALARTVARNKRGRKVLAAVIAAEPEATLLMLEVVVENLGLPFERVSLGALGLAVGSS